MLRAFRAVECRAAGLRVLLGLGAFSTVGGLRVSGCCWVVGLHVPWGSGLRVSGQGAFVF